MPPSSLDRVPDARKLLVVTSDDFGMCHAVNTGVVRAMADGCISSTTLMAPCPWFAEAVALTKQHRLPVGVHLTLTCEWDRYRWGPITGARGLMASDGGFPDNVPDIVERATDEEIFAEFEAQVQRVLSAGIEPTHIDMHMIGGDDARPGLSRIHEQRRKICQKYRLQYTRECREGAALTYLTDQTSSSGQSEAKLWSALASWTEPGRYHVIAHVADGSPELDAVCSADHPARAWGTAYRSADLALWSKPSTRTRLRELGFELVDVKTLLADANAAS